jgi:hypothetical protein
VASKRNQLTHSAGRDRTIGTQTMAGSLMSEAPGT